MEEFMMTLDLCRKKANHPSTIADIKDLINHFSVLTNIRPDGGLPGGIDFRALPLKDCSVDPAALFNGVPASAVNMDIDAEWKSIESLVNRGILPSCRRVTELTAACYAKGALANRSENLLECLSSILRLEEERDQPTESVLRDILVLLEAA
jgi:hypothetical protein